MYREEERFGQRVTMTLCYASSEDESHPATALRYQTRASYGWQSAKYCKYPQELGFRFDGIVSLQYLRILTHELKRSRLIDFAVALATPEELQTGVCVPYEKAQFTTVGFTRFTPPNQTPKDSRELRTVGIKRQCTYLKLCLAPPHASGYNLFSQVGIAALAAHGTTVRTLAYPSCGNTKPIVVGEISQLPLDDMMPLARGELNTAHYDGAPTDATTLEDLRRWKARAVAEEDYDLAARLKLQIEACESREPLITKLRSEKHRAVQAEDYVRAKQIKQQMDGLSNPYPPFTESSLSASDGGQPHTRQQAVVVCSGSNGSDPILTDVRGPAATARASASAGVPSKPPPLSPRRPLSGPVAAGAAVRPVAHDEVVVSGKGFYDLDGTGEPFAEKVAGAVGGQGAEVPQKGNGAPWEWELNTKIASFITDMSAPTALSGDAAQEGKAYEKDLGIYCTACLLAKRGQLREAAIRGIMSKVGYRAVGSHTSTGVETLLTYLSSHGRGVNDSVAGVVFATCEALQKLAVSGHLGGHVPASAQLAGHMSKVLSDLVGRLGDPNSRIRETVEGALTTLAHPSVEPNQVVSLLMVDPDREAKRAVSYRAHLGRVKLLSSLVGLYGVRRGGSTNPAAPYAFDTRQLMDNVVSPSMQNANSEVREAAAKLFAKLLTLDRGVAEPYLTHLKAAQQAVVEEELSRLRREQPATPTAQVPLGDDGTPQVARRAPPPAQSAGSRPPTTELVSESKTVERVTSVKAGAGESGGGAVGSAAQSEASLSPLESDNSQTEQELRSSRTCQFCGEFNRNFTEANIDSHYVRACPMLCPCPLCDQVTEICTMQQHLVSECEGMRLVRECPRCHEAVRAEEYKHHVAAQSCIEASAALSVCPLCHAQFPVGMDGWRQHLAAPPGCPNNPRKYDGSGPVML